MSKRYLFDIAVLAGRLRPPVGMKPYACRRRDWDDWDDWEKVDRQIEFLQSLLNIGLKGLEPGASRRLTYGELRIRLQHFMGWGELASLAESLHIWPDPKDAKASGPALVERLKAIKAYNHRVRQIVQLARAAVQALEARTPEGAEYPDDTPCPLITVVNGTDEGVGFLLSWRKPVGRLRSNVPTLVLARLIHGEGLVVVFDGRFGAGRGASRRGFRRAFGLDFRGALEGGTQGLAVWGLGPGHQAGAGRKVIESDRKSPALGQAAA